MSEKLNGVHGSSLFIDGIEILRITLNDKGEPQISLGLALGTAIEYLENPTKMEENKKLFQNALSELIGVELPKAEPERKH